MQDFKSQSPLPCRLIRIEKFDYQWQEYLTLRNLYIKYAGNILPLLIQLTTDYSDYAELTNSE